MVVTRYLAKPVISNVYALNPDFMYLLFIQNLNSGFKSCDIHFQKGQIHFAGFAFLQFCKKYDICTWN